MEFLQQLFGNLTSGVIRLAVAVGIIVAVGVFIVKPILDTTNHAVDNSSKVFEKSFESTTFDTKAIEKQIHESLEGVNGQVQVQVEHSVHTAKVQGGDKRTQRLLHCVQRANGNVHRMERCAKKY
jgi:predicted PurR-regulated permease PerM